MLVYDAHLKTPHTHFCGQIHFCTAPTDQATCAKGITNLECLDI